MVATCFLMICGQLRSLALQKIMRFSERKAKLLNSRLRLLRWMNWNFCCCCRRRCCVSQTHGSFAFANEEVRQWTSVFSDQKLQHKILVLSLFVQTPERGNHWSISTFVHNRVFSVLLDIFLSGNHFSQYVDKGSHFTGSYYSTSIDQWEEAKETSAASEAKQTKPNQTKLNQTHAHKLHSICVLGYTSSVSVFH